MPGMPMKDVTAEPSPRRIRQIGLKFVPGTVIAVAIDTIWDEATLNVRVSTSVATLMEPSRGTSHPIGSEVALARGTQPNIKSTAAEKKSRKGCEREKQQKPIEDSFSGRLGDHPALGG